MEFLAFRSFHGFSMEFSAFKIFYKLFKSLSFQAFSCFNFKILCKNSDLFWHLINKIFLCLQFHITSLSLCLLIGYSEGVLILAMIYIYILVSRYAITKLSACLIISIDILGSCSKGFCSDKSLVVCTLNWQLQSMVLLPQLNLNFLDV